MIVMGGSAGSMTVLSGLLPIFPADYPLPVVIVQHLHPQQDGYYIEHFQAKCRMNVKEADEKESIRPGTIYFAPPNYHLLIEQERTFSLSIDEKVNYTRPSIDVLFESAADVYGARLIGVILTGANQDGACGLKLIKQRGGLAMVQDPRTAESAYMPQSAIEMSPVDYVLPVREIGELLLKIAYQAII